MLKNTSSWTQTKQYLYPIIGKIFNQDKNLIGLIEQNISLKLLPNLTVTGSLKKMLILRLTALIYSPFQFNKHRMSESVHIHKNHTLIRLNPRKINTKTA